MVNGTLQYSLLNIITKNWRHFILLITISVQKWNLNISELRNFNYSIFVFNFNLILVLYTKIKTNGYIERMLLIKKKIQNTPFTIYIIIWNWKYNNVYNLCVGFGTFHYLSLLKNQKSVSDSVLLFFFYISKYIGYWVLMEEVFFLIWVVLFNKLIVLLKYLFFQERIYN